MTGRLLPGTPFVGLVPYGEEDAAFFFGRDEEQEIVTGNLRAARLTILYGASGVGKTSLLHAGVVHGLREQVRAARPGRTPFAVCAFSAWRVDPLPALAEAMRGACVEALGGEELAAWAPGEPLADAARGWTERVRPLLVVLDQFEDYFLYHPDEDGDGTFAVEFPRLVNELNLRVNVVLSLREDAWAKLDRFEGRIPALFANYVRVEHLGRRAAREAIEGPVGEWNRRLAPGERPYEVEPALAEAVIEAAAAGRLGLGEGGDGADPTEGASADAVEAPFLQLVLERLWRATVEAGAHTLDLARLEALGGAQQIVENHLLEALGKLTPGEQAVAADLFRFLVTRSRTKIAHQASDLAEWTNRPEPEVAAVLQKLCRGESGRILRSISPPAGETAVTYELFHDVLAEPILEWRRDYEQERTRRLALRRYARIGGVLLSLVALFAAIGVWALLQRSDAKRATKAAVVQQRAAERATRSAVEQRRAAQRATRSATSLALASASRDQLGQRLDASLLLGLAAYEESPSSQARSAMLSALEAARRSGLRSIAEGHAVAVRSVAFSGRTLAVARNDGTLTLWDLRTGKARRFPTGSGALANLAFGPGGKTLAATRGTTVELWDVRSRKLLRPPFSGSKVDIGEIESLAFSPDGRTVATGGGEYDPTVRLWDVRTGKQRGRPLAAHRDYVYTVAFGPDGRSLVSASNDGTVRFWNVRTHEQIGEPLSGDRAVLTRDGRTLALTSGDRITLWNVRSRTQVGRALSGYLAAFSPDGHTLASTTGETLSLWDGRTGGRLGPPLRGHTNTISTIAFAPDGRTLASAGYDGTVRLWSVRPRTRLGRLLPGHSASVQTVGFSRDGKTLASAGSDGVVRLVSVRTGRQLGKALPGQRAFFSPNGRSIVASDPYWIAHLYDVRTRKRIGRPLSGHTFAFSKNGRMLASGTGDGTVLWDARTQRRLGKPVRGFVPAFSPRGRTLATGGNDGRIRLWDLRTRTEIGHPWSGHTDVIEAVAFSPDGRTLASASDDETVRLWDVRTGMQRGRPLRGHMHVVSSVAFSPDGRTLASTSFDGTVRLWDVASHAQLGEVLGEPIDGNAYTNQGASVAFSPDGRTLASGGIDGKVRLWEGILWRNPRDLRRLVCGRLVLGDLTRPEWEELVPGLPYRATCPAR